MSFAASTAIRSESFVPVSVPVEDRVHAERGEFAAVLSMRHAGPSPVRLRYEWVGPADAPVVVLAGGISAHRHVASMHSSARRAGPRPGGQRGALDPQQLRVLAFDFIGADGALDVPIDTADQADALALLLDHLGIRALKAFVGYSYGALVGQQFAIRHRAACASWYWPAARIARIRMPPPGARCSAVRSRLASCSAAKTTAWPWRGSSPCSATARRKIRRALRCRAGSDQRPRTRGRRRLPRRGRCAVRRAHAGDRLPAPVRIDRPASCRPHRDPAADRGGGRGSDRLVPLADLVGLVEELGPRGSLRVLRSPYGHDAFLKETDRIDAILATAFRTSGESA